MKLHFYFIEKPWRREPHIKYVSAEVEEKPKTYIVKERIRGFYESRISKCKIGIMLTGYKEKVILLERDDEKAKRIFTEYYNLLISCREKEISDYKGIIKMIDAWEE